MWSSEGHHGGVQGLVSDICTRILIFSSVSYLSFQHITYSKSVLGASFIKTWCSVTARFLRVYTVLHSQYFENCPLLTAFLKRPGFKSFRNRRCVNWSRNRIESEMETATVLENSAHCETFINWSGPMKFETLIFFTGVYRGPTIILFWGVGGDFEKNIMQVHMRKKKIPAQDHRPPKNSRTCMGWKKNSGKMFPVLTHWTFASANC